MNYIFFFFATLIITSLVSADDRFEHISFFSLGTLNERSLEKQIAISEFPISKMEWARAKNDCLEPTDNEFKVNISLREINDLLAIANAEVNESSTVNKIIYRLPRAYELSAALGKKRDGEMFSWAKDLKQISQADPDLEFVWCDALFGEHPLAPCVYAIHEPFTELVSQTIPERRKIYGSLGERASFDWVSYWYYPHPIHSYIVPNNLSMEQYHSNIGFYLIRETQSPAPYDASFDFMWRPSADTYLKFAKKYESENTTPALDPIRLWWPESLSAQASWFPSHQPSSRSAEFSKEEIDRLLAILDLHTSVKGRN